MGLAAAGTPFYDLIDYITFSTTGDAVDFGNLVQQKVGGPAGFSNSTRGCFAGGAAPSAIDEIDYVTMASTGNAQDFGNLVAAAMHFCGSASSPIRGIVAGDGPAGSNVIQYVITATRGNAADFGDLSVSKRGGGLGSSSNAVRGLFSGGYSPGSGSPAARTVVIDYITLAALGNAVDFGNLSAVRSLPATTASSTRGIIAGGTQGSPLAEVNIIEYVQIASTGNSVDFGDLAYRPGHPYVVSAPTRGVWMAGKQSPEGLTNIMEYIEIMTLGNSTDFGDSTLARSGGGSTSNGHGGL